MYFSSIGLGPIDLSSFITVNGVASYGALGHVPFLEFWKFCPFCSCCQLNCKILKITKEKYVLHFRLFHQQHVKTQVNRLKQSRNPNENPGGEEKFMNPSFPGDATDHCHQFYRHNYKELSLPVTSGCYQSHHNTQHLLRSGWR